MSEDRSERGIQGRLGSGALRTRGQARREQVGDLNVISGAAVPNRLSTEAFRPTSVLSGTREAVPGRTMPDGVTPGQRRIPLPSLPTLIFLGFVAITAFRLFGEFAEGFAPAAPGATSPAGSGAMPTKAGVIIFGTGSNEDCGVIGEGVRFETGTDVWWSARLSAVQAADAGAVVIVRRDDQEIEREEVPPDASFGAWDQLCSGGPVVEGKDGSYRVEIWDDDVAVLLATGAYSLSNAP